MGGLAGEEDSDNVVAPSGPYGGWRLLNILVINRLSGAAYRCAVYCPGACRCISIRSLNLATLIHAFFSPFFCAPHCVYSIGSSETLFFPFFFSSDRVLFVVGSRGARLRVKTEQLGNEKGARDETGGGRRLEY